MDSKEDIIGLRIAAAEAAGFTLSDIDKSVIRKLDFESHSERRIANRSFDPMKKGTAFPLGVGYTKMTKRASQRIDSSVRRAGESVAAAKKLAHMNRDIDALLVGKGTDADKQRKAKRREQMQRELVQCLLAWKKGDTIATFTVERVNKDRDGYPASYTISGHGIIKGIYDKVDVVRELFSGDKNSFRKIVDEQRAGRSETMASDPQVLPVGPNSLASMKG